VVDDTWQGGCVGLYSATAAEPVTLVWDNFRCGLDTNADGTLDVVHADYNFDGAWNVLTLTHDAAGNLTGDGLLKYEYDAWNRLVRARYDNAVAAADPVIATYEYDGLFRRIEKTVSNQGIGVVFRSDGGGALLPVVEGIQAGNRHEHYFYSGWRLVETTDHAESGGFYSYVAAHVLGQFAYGTQYIDEPVCMDVNSSPTHANDCDPDTSDPGGGTDRRYFYLQDRNWTVGAILETDDGAGTAGRIAERYAYTPYGEFVVLKGDTASGNLGNILPASTLGNPLAHQGLPFDQEKSRYQNRYREYCAPVQRFVQRDPLGYVAGFSLYQYMGADPITRTDPSGRGGDPCLDGCSAEHNLTTAICACIPRLQWLQRILCFGCTHTASNACAAACGGGSIPPNARCDQCDGKVDGVTDCQAAPNPYQCARCYYACVHGDCWSW